jgi:hypothetical protein
MTFILFIPFLPQGPELVWLAAEEGWEMAVKLEERAAVALYAAMRRRSRGALVQGDPSMGEETLIDGTFDLRMIARDVLRRLGYPAVASESHRTSSGTGKNAE